MSRTPQRRTPTRRPDNYFVQLLDERFDRLHDRLDTIEQDRARRDLDVNLMDTTNKAEIKAVKDQVIVVAGELTRLKWIFQAACWCVLAFGGFVTWLTGVWRNVEGAVYRAIS